MNFTGISGHTKQLGFLGALRESGAIPHAILFTGQSGIGKRLIAERFLKSIYCESPESPCLQCSVCRQIEARSFPDFLVLDRDEKGKIPVGNRDKPAAGTVRWLIEQITRTPVSGRYAVIVDGVHTISETGQNALLKTIEEPGPSTTIVMTAEGRAGILPTILSRCVNITFNPLDDKDVGALLAKEGVKAADVPLITAMSGGSLDCAFRLGDDRIMKNVLDFAASLSDAVKTGNMSHIFVSDKQQDPGDSFLLRVLINIYSSLLRSFSSGREPVLPDSVVTGADDTFRLLKILLAIKKGENNNLNFRSILKGMAYSMDRIDVSLTVDPDFSWL